MKLELAYQNNEESGVGRITAAARLLGNHGVKQRTLDCYALVYVIRGEGEFCDALGGKMPVRAGTAILVFPGIEHSYGSRNSAGWDELYMMFEGPVFDLWQRQGILDPHRAIHELHPVDLWQDRVSRTWHDGGSALEQICRLQSLLAGVVATGKEAGSVDDQEWLKRARALLEASAAAADGALDSAQQMGMAYQTFRKTFRRLHGCAPGKYRSACLMNEATRRLMVDAVPIKQLADELGFCDEFHFSRRFKQCIGISPTAYRARLPRGR